MTKIEIIKNGDLVVGFCAVGHADFGTRGTDIVCAAASAIIQTAALGIIKVIGINATVTRADGKFTLVLPEGLCAKKQLDSRVIFDTMVCGIRDLEKQFPKNIKLGGL